MGSEKLIILCLCTKPNEFHWRNAPTHTHTYRHTYTQHAWCLHLCAFLILFGEKIYSWCNGLTSESCQHCFWGFCFAVAFFLTRFCCFFLFCFVFLVLSTVPLPCTSDSNRTIPLAVTNVFIFSSDHIHQLILFVNNIFKEKFFSFVLQISWRFFVILLKVRNFILETSSKVD